MKRLLIGCLIIAGILVPLRCAYAGEGGPEGRTATLMESMRDPDPMVRRAAAAGLGETGDKVAAPILADVLANDTDADVRLTALGALQRIGGDFANPAFEKALGDPDERVRQGAANALSGSWGKSAHKALMEALKNDKSAKVRRSVAEALGNPGIMGRYSAHGWDGAEITEQALVGALKSDSDYGVRATAAQMLGKFKNDMSLKALMSAVDKDDNTSVRSAAAESLGALGMQQAVGPLVKIVYFEKDEMLLTSALKALKYYNDPSIGDAVISALGSVSPRVRWQAIDVLEELRLKDSVDALSRIAADDYEPEGIRYKAKEALQMMGVQ